MRATEFVVEALTPEQTAKLFKDLGAKYDANIHDNVFKGKQGVAEVYCIYHNFFRLLRFVQ